MVGGAGGARARSAVAGWRRGATPNPAGDTGPDFDAEAGKGFSKIPFSKTSVFNLSPPIRLRPVGHAMPLTGGPRDVA
jgi:hypothetical protein